MVFYSAKLLKKERVKNILQLNNPGFHFYGVLLYRTGIYNYLCVRKGRK